MEYKLAYGKEGMVLHLDEEYHIDVIQPKFSPPLAFPREKVRESLRYPYASEALKKRISRNDTVGIIFSDITRPVPTETLLQIILEELSHVDECNITLFNALGSHRANTDDEMRKMIGSDIFDKYLVIQNDAFDPKTLRFFGKTSRDHEIYVNEALSSCDHIILTGFIEPHFFAGFSGGGKAIMPGMAGIQTILKNHGPEMIADPNASFGVTEGNPIWEEIYEIGKLLNDTFLINVTLNKEKEITGVFSGDLYAAHVAGCVFAKEMAMVEVEQPYDIVITTNSGYPLDINLYQSVKGMSAAARITKKGGSIIIAAECKDGIPTHGCYGTLLREAASPKELLDRIMASADITPDQWQAQIQAQIQMDADVYVFSGNLDKSQIISSMLLPCEDIEQIVGDLILKYGKEARICILPEGPQTIPFVQ